MDPFVSYVSCLSLLCYLVCWKRTDLLAFLSVVFSCVFVTFPICVLIHIRTKGAVKHVKAFQ